MYTFCTELTIKILNDYQLSLKTPWLEIICRVEANIYSYLKQAADDNLIKNKTLQEKRFLTFLNQFSSYPIQLINPRKNLNFTYKEVIYEKADKDELIKYKKELSNFPIYCLNKTDINSTVKFCKILSNNKIYDPLSAISCLRILAHKIYSKPKDNFINLKSCLLKLIKKDEKKFIKAIAIIIKNNYQITKSCQWALKPATQIHPNLTSSVTTFMREESGHDYIIMESLKALDINDPNSIEHPHETDLMMQTLRKSATKNVISFLAILGWFEGESYIKHDYLYNLMKLNIKTEKAIKGLRQHDIINEKGEHHLIGLHMAKRLPPVNLNSILNGCYIFSQYLSYYNRAQYNLTKTINNL